MCGIFGYVGNENASDQIANGLKRLEYRGYDSWGIAVLCDKNGLSVVRKTGAIGDLSSIDKLPHSSIGIGHTRWATHGGVKTKNAHPHKSSDGRFAVAQNGIVENYQQLKSELIKKNHKFISETDTEVIVRLIEEKLKKTPDIKEASMKAFAELEGRNTIIILVADRQEIIAIRNGSPLVIGIGDNEYFIASDTLSFADKTDTVIFIENQQLVHIHNGQIKLFDCVDGREIKHQVEKLTHTATDISKEGYEHFMLKEIMEQPDTIRAATAYTEKELTPLVEAIKRAETVYTVGAGTAGYAAGQIAYYLRKYAKKRAFEIKSYEFNTFNNIWGKNDLLIAVSQSGETADTIEVLEHAKERKVKIASIVNMLGSTTTRLSDFAYMSRTGAEVCVASTKAFTAQIAWGLLLAHCVNDGYKFAKNEIKKTTQKLESFLNKKNVDSIKKIAANLASQEHFFILGKGENYYTAMEGALKIKEITYKHFEGFPAGELKHGVIALIDKGTTVMGIIDEDEFKNDMLSAMAEVKARGANTIVIGKKNNELFDSFVRTASTEIGNAILNIVPFQLLSYYLGVHLNNDPDKPRNLAKSVTVK